MTVTIIEYVNSKAPASLKVSGQLLFSVFILSSARVLSSLIGGFLSKAFGYRGMYLFSSVFVLVVWAAFALYQKITKESYQL